MYRLHWRRDLCKGCTNNNWAFPKYFHAGCFVRRSNPTLPLIQVGDVRAAPLGDEKSSSPIWSSDTIEAGGLTFNFEIRFWELNNPNNRSTLQFHWMADGISRGWLPMSNLNETLCAEYNSGIQVQSVRDRDNAWWGATSVLATSGCLRVLWDEE
jgi:hypothetical protein